MKVMGFIMVNSPCLFLQVVGVCVESTPLESSLSFTWLGFFCSTCSGRCSGKRFASSMYVIVVIRVNSPCRFLLFVDTSIVSTPLESSHVFTCLGFLSPTCSGNAAIEIRLIDEGHGIHHGELTVSVFAGCRGVRWKHPPRIEPCFHLAWILLLYLLWKMHR